MRNGMRICLAFKRVLIYDSLGPKNLPNSWWSEPFQGQQCPDQPHVQDILKSQLQSWYQYWCFECLNINLYSQNPNSPITGFNTKGATLSSLKNDENCTVFFICYGGFLFRFVYKIDPEYILKIFVGLSYHGVRNNLKNQDEVGWQRPLPVSWLHHTSTKEHVQFPSSRMYKTNWIKLCKKWGN